MKTNKIFFFLLIFSIKLFSQQSIVKVEGVIIDSGKTTIPYAAIGIVSKSIGTSSNDDGEFYLKLTRENLSDTLTVSSIVSVKYPSNFEINLSKSFFEDKLRNSKKEYPFIKSIVYAIFGFNSGYTPCMLGVLNHLLLNC